MRRAGLHGAFFLPANSGQTHQCSATHDAYIIIISNIKNLIRTCRHARFKGHDLQCNIVRLDFKTQLTQYTKL